VNTPTYPPKIFIGITDKCNANCIMCWRSFHKGEFKDMDEKILKKISNAFSLSEELGWWGDGEIFCCGYLDKIFNYMKEYPNAKHKFSTNGQLLYQYADRLSGCNISEIIISIDGATEETLSSIRKGCHVDKIKDGIVALYNAFDGKGKTRPIIYFSFIAMSKNIQEMPLLVNLASELSVPIVFIQQFKLFDGLEYLIPDHEDFKKYYSEANEVAKNLGVELKSEYPL
jgi:MoaA/NifB/PqqE/SkfB family radical SAM enzyme